MIEISHARVNNLKDVTINIPRNKFIVIAGVSGSGKSSLAFDTLYAEGQRRYVESLSSYARQFLGRMAKPECDYIKGLPPAIAIEQKVISRNPRSTVGTNTEIYEYLRLLFARIGRTFSPISKQEVKKHSVEDIISCVQTYQRGTKYIITAPLHVPEGRTLERQLEMMQKAGYARIYYKGEIIRIEDVKIDDIKDQSQVSLLIDRMSVDDSKDIISRLYDSVETAFYEGHGVCRLIFMPAMIEHEFSTRFEADGITFEEPTDNLFAFNSPVGACPKCEGFGKIIGIDEQLVIPNPSLSVYDGCVQCWHGEKMKMWKEEFCRRAMHDDFPIFEPYYNLSDEHKDWLWNGLPSDKGVDIYDKVSINEFFRMLTENQYKIQYRVMLARYRGKTICPECHGSRLRKEANYVRIGADQNGEGGKTITQLVEMSIAELLEWFNNVHFTEHESQIAKRLLTEITSRLQFLVDVGLGYLSLNRASNTLSGGESQRINLCTNLGSSLVGSLYILDEPSIGLHSRDTDRLIKVLRQLQEIGNTVIVVEHDEEIMRAADYLIDVGPDAGRHGGEIVFEGPIDAITHQPAYANDKSVRSHTVDYLTHTESIEVPASRRQWNRSIIIRSPRLNNLKGVDVEIPLNVMTVVTGVSGSGKSSLIKGIFYPALRRALGDVSDTPGVFGGLDGDIKAIKHVEFVDQNPIGKSTRSNPATYVKAYDAIRQLMAEQPLSKQMGFTPQHFSFNAEGGRCEECKGSGVITVEMQFMADLELVCEECHGKRFKHDILEVRYKGKNIYDILDMTINQAIEFFGENDNDSSVDKKNIKSRRSSSKTEDAIIARLKPLQDVGLGYIKLGQSSSTLSGGENQRVKLGYFIGQEKQDPTLFIFDEPTTGLHFHDIHKLLNAFTALIQRGHTILIIEHNMDIIKCADHIIDLGPEGGHCGGNIVCTGTPENVAECKESFTGHFLKEKLKVER